MREGKEFELTILVDEGTSKKIKPKVTSELLIGVTVGDIQKGSLPAIAIVGANIPIATGVALSFKMQKKKNIICCLII